MTCDRKAIKRNLISLIEFGYDINFSEIIRTNANGDEETICTDWYLNRDFSDSELRLLIDSLLFSKHIPYSQCKELIEKLKGLSNRYFSAKVSHIRNLPDHSLANKQIFYTIDILDEAISKGRQVSFYLTYFDTDKKSHLRKDSNGNAREYIINPYQIVATNGRYYLICNNNKYASISNYRVDRIADIKLLETKCKEKKLVKGLENGFNLPTHMAEHIYMTPGESSRVKFRSKRIITTDIIDWFGEDVVFSDVTDDEVTVSVKVNENAMFCWAMQYGENVTVLSPQSLVERLRMTLEEMRKRYE